MSADEVMNLEDGDLNWAKIDLDYYADLFTPEKWKETFTPEYLAAWRDMNGSLLYGATYDERCETLFNRFLNPAASAFAHRLTEEGFNHENPGWVKVLLALQKWADLRIYFIYAIDPFDYLNRTEQEIFMFDPSDELFLRNPSVENYDDEDD